MTKFLQDLLFKGNLTVSPTTLASSGIGRSIYANPTLSATANGDVLIGVDIAPAFSNGGFTGVANFGLRVVKTTADGYVLLQGPAPSLRMRNDVGGSTLDITWAGVTTVNNYIQGAAVGDQVMINYRGAFIISAGAFARNYVIDFKVSALGNTLLGTNTDAGYKLDVLGNIRATGTINITGGTGTGTITQAGGTTAFGNYTTGIGSSRRFYTFMDSGAGSIWVGQSNYAAIIQTNSNTGAAEFGSYEAGSAYMTLRLSTGNVLVNTVSNIAGYNLQVSGDVYFYTANSTQQTVFGYATGTSGRIVSNSTALYVRADNDLSLGSGGNNDIVILKSDGNVLIGHSTNATYKLDVLGSVRLRNDGLLVQSSSNSSNFISWGGFHAQLMADTNGALSVGDIAADGVNKFIVKGAIRSTSNLWVENIYLSGNSSDPSTGVAGTNNGVLIYRTDIHKFRGRVQGSWKNFLTEGDITLQTAVDADKTNSGTLSVGTTTIKELSATSYAGVFFDYVVINGTNRRVGTVVAITNGTNVESYETFSNDLGSTTDLTFTVDLSAGNLRLRAAATTSGWSVIVSTRAI